VRVPGYYSTWPKILARIRGPRRTRAAHDTPAAAVPTNHRANGRDNELALMARSNRSKDRVAEGEPNAIEGSVLPGWFVSRRGSSALALLAFALALKLNGGPLPKRKTRGHVIQRARLAQEHAQQSERCLETERRDKRGRESSVTVSPSTPEVYAALAAAEPRQSPYP
jgi:hypothetical protein